MTPDLTQTFYSFQSFEQDNNSPTSGLTLSPALIQQYTFIQLGGAIHHTNSIFLSQEQNTIILN